MKNKILFPVLVLLMSSQLALSHDTSNNGNKRKGYIITIDGKRTDGYIESTKEMALMKSILFAVDRNGPSTIYTPNDLISYQFMNGSIYDSFEIPLNNGEPARRFLKLISKTGTKLYKFKDSDGLRFFVLNNGALIELKKQKSPQSDLNMHVETLRAITGDCEKVKVRKSLPFSAFAILSILKAYDKCKQSTTRTQTKVIKTQWDVPVRFSAYIGLPLSVDGGGTGSIKQFSVEYNLKSNPLRLGQAFMLGVYKQRTVSNNVGRPIFFPPGPINNNFPQYRFVDNFGFLLKYRLSFKPLKKICFTSAIGIISANESRTTFDTVNNNEDTQSSSADLYYSLDIGFRYAFNKRHEIRLEIISGKITSIQIGYAASFFE